MKTTAQSGVILLKKQGPPSVLEYTQKTISKPGSSTGCHCYCHGGQFIKKVNRNESRG
jgi:hypothetical protein